MAIRHIREAFDQAAEGQAQCQQALLRYEDDGKGGQHQIITVKGCKLDGTVFNLSTPPHAMADDPHHHVRELVKILKEEEEPTAAAAGERPAAIGSSAGKSISGGG